MTTHDVATGFVVAGGRSRRMGRDKALLPWAEATLLDHALARLRTVCGDVRILSGPEPRYLDRGAPVDIDVRTDAGALGGVLTGLLVLERPLGLFLAVDLPLVPQALLQQLLGWAEGYDAVVPISSGGPEPLCAVYARSCLGAVQKRIESGEFKMTSFWQDVRVLEIPAADLAAFGDVDRLFANVNAPEDYSRLATER